MVANSRVNPNYPTPGVDQTSKGFRDNFSIIKHELEDIQGKSIVLTGDVSAQALIDSGSGDVILDCVVSVANIAAGGGNLNIQYNNMGVVSGAPNFIYDPNNGYVGLGTSVPQSSLDIYGSAIIRNILVLENQDVGNTGAFYLANNAGTNTITTVDSSPIFVQINSSNIMNIGSSGISVGIGSTPSSSTVFDVNSSGANLSKFSATGTNVDAGIRITTSQPTTSAGVILEQLNANSVGGMKIKTNGDVTIHSGESASSQLSDGSARIIVAQSGLVGIGSSIPSQTLDVNGGLRVMNYIVSDPLPILTTNGSGIVVDAWSPSQFRTARYIVQATDQSGNTDVTELLVIQANGAVQQTTIANLANAGSLGVITTQVNGGLIELVYTALANNVKVKAATQYVTI